jgi:hypothetical protein
MKPTSVRQRNRHSQPRAFARTIALVSALCALAFANFATAQTAYSFNQASGNWHTTTHWSPNGTPTSSDPVTIAGYSNWNSRTATISAGNTGSASSVTLQGQWGGGANLTVNGALEVGNNVTVGTQGGNPPATTYTFTQGDTIAR